MNTQKNTPDGKTPDEPILADVFGTVDQKAVEAAEAEQDAANVPQKPRVVKCLVYVAQSRDGFVASIDANRCGKIVPVEQTALLLKEINMNLLPEVYVGADGWHMFHFIEPSELRRWSRLIYGQNEPLIYGDTEGKA